MIDVTSALEYLHHGQTTLILHFDLKPINVLLDKDMIAHVCDFGIAKLLGEDEFMAQTKTLVTTGYMARLKLQSYERRMMGKELEGLSFKELQHLEHQLNEGILSFKDKKEQKMMLENETLLRSLDHAAQHHAIRCFQLHGKVQVVIADQKEIVIQTHLYAWQRVERVLERYSKGVIHEFLTSYNIINHLHLLPSFASTISRAWKLKIGDFVIRGVAAQSSTTKLRLVA
ncbi:hypothetical protein LguiA_004744 [Lonicera macranthoides]